MASNDAYIDNLNIEVKKELTSLLISSPKGLSVKQLRFDYSDYIGRPIPFKEMGHLTLESYLMSIPDILRVVGNGIYAMVVPVVTEKTKHINEMILKQKAPKSNSRYKPMRRSKGIYNVKSEIPPLMSLKPQYGPDVEPFKFPVNPDSHKRVLPPPHDYFLENRMQQNSASRKKFNKSYSKPQENTRTQYRTEDKPFQFPVNPDSHKIVLPAPPDYVPETRRQQSSAPNKQLNMPYRESQENSVSYSCDTRLNNRNNIQDKQTYQETRRCYKSLDTVDTDSGEDNDAEFFQELYFSDDEEFSYISDNETDLTTSVKNMALTDKIKNLIEAQIIEDSEMEEPHIPRVSKKVIDKLKILISEHPDGIWCSKLLKLYEQRFGHKLDPFNFGFSSVVQMCDDLPDVFHCVRPNRTDWKLYDKNNPVPDTYTVQDFSKYLESLPITEEFKMNTEPPLPSDVMYESPSFEYPDNVMQPGELSKRQWLVDHEKAGEYIEILVTEVYDPSKFWIHLRGPTTSDALGKLMDDMQIYYMNNAKDLQLNDTNVQVGMMCAAVFMEEYHRAVVLKIFDDQTIKVFYCDYGTVSLVCLRKACYLLKDFGELPMQAVRARLANIIPREQNTMWPRAAATFMLKLVAEKDLIAFINAIDYEQEILDLIITDTTTDIDVHINDELLDNGFAVLGSEAPLCTTSSALIPNVHLYPAFEELENAIYPCIGDVVTMLKIGHTYETIFHGYFASSANSDNTHDYSALHHSRCSTDVDQSYLLSANSSQTEIYMENNDKSLHQDSLAYENYVEQEYEDSSRSNSNAESSEISSVNSESKIEVDVEKKLEDSKDSPNFETNCDNYAESTGIEDYVCKKPPPGFENVRPRQFDGTEFINMFRKEENTVMSNPMYPLNPLAGMPLVQNPLTYQNYPLLNSNLNSSYNYLLSNPLLYSQLMINQQREAILQTVQQVHLAEELHKLQALKQQQQFIQMTQAANRFPQNYNIPTTSQNSDYNPQPDMTYQHKPVINPASSVDNDLSSCSLKVEQLHDNNQDTYSESSNNNFPITTEINSDYKYNISEHICDRFVLKLKMDDYQIHILNIDGEFYVVSQEIITNLLKNDLSWKKWLKYMNLSATSIPNKLVNIMDYERVYNQIKEFIIPGVNPSNNLGCNVRLTSLHDVTDIVEKYGNKNLLPDLKKGITHVIENPDVWKVFDPLTD